MLGDEKQALLELAERCEKATEPDAELDKLVHEARGFCVHRETEYYCIEDGNDCDSGFTCKACRKDTYGEKVPRYTASLDAAMTLAKDFGGQVTFFKDGTAKAFLWQPYPMAVEGKAAAPALALTAAALRALATPGTNHAPR